jgi:hypothetical protein
VKLLAADVQMGQVEMRNANATALAEITQPCVACCCNAHCDAWPAISAFIPLLSALSVPPFKGSSSVARKREI